LLTKVVTKAVTKAVTKVVTKVYYFRPLQMSVKRAYLILFTRSVFKVKM